jgi:hypothetical protein
MAGKCTKTKPLKCPIWSDDAHCFHFLIPRVSQPLAQVVAVAHDGPGTATLRHLELQEALDGMDSLRPDDLWFILVPPVM